MAFNRVGKQLSLEREKEPVTFPLHSNVNLREQLDWSYPKKKKKIPPRDFSKITAANKRLSDSKAKLGYHFNIKHEMTFFSVYKNTKIF